MSEGIYTGLTPFPVLRVPWVPLCVCVQVDIRVRVSLYTYVCVFKDLEEQTGISMETSSSAETFF